MIKRILKIFVSIIYYLLNRIRIIFRRILNKPLHDSCIVLFYHSIPDIYLKKFQRQLDYLQKKTTVVPIDFQKLSCNNIRYSIITFDDAFQSVIKNALPLLYERKMPSTIFVPSGCLGEKPSWLQETDHADKNEHVATLSQLLDLNRDYISIGSHSINHSHLPELNENDAMNEINNSRLFLEKKLNCKIKYIAFPFGEYNEKIIDLCKKSNYEQVFTIDTYSPYSSTDAYERGRVAIDPWDWTIEYRLKILGAYSWMPYASKIKRKIKGIQ